MPTGRDGSTRGRKTGERRPSPGSGPRGTGEPRCRGRRPVRNVAAIPVGQSWPRKPCSVHSSRDLARRPVTVSTENRPTDSDQPVHCAGGNSRWAWPNVQPRPSATHALRLRPRHRARCDQSLQEDFSLLLPHFLDHDVGNLLPVQPRHLHYGLARCGKVDVGGRRPRFVGLLGFVRCWGVPVSGSLGAGVLTPLAPGSAAVFVVGVLTALAPRPRRRCWRSARAVRASSAARCCCCGGSCPTLRATSTGRLLSSTAC